LAVTLRDSGEATLKKLAPTLKWYKL